MMGGMGHTDYMDEFVMRELFINIDYSLSNN